MNLKISRLLETTYAKIFVGTIIGVIGLAGGIKIGYALIGNDTSGQDLSPITGSGQNTHDLHLAFGEGDIFPPESFVDSNGETRPFQALFNKEQTVLLFTDFECGKCTELLEFWNRSIQSQLGDDVEAVVCLDMNEKTVPIDYQPLLKNKTIVWYDRLEFKALYDLHVLPTLVVVGADGLVQFYVVGFGGQERQTILASFS